MTSVANKKANLPKIRPPGIRKPFLNREQLSEFTRRLQMFSMDGVEKIYQTAYADCHYDGKRLPLAATVQQLVATWKVLRRMHRAK